MRLPLLRPRSVSGSVSATGPTFLQRRDWLVHVTPGGETYERSGLLACALSARPSVKRPAPLAEEQNISARLLLRMILLVYGSLRGWLWLPVFLFLIALEKCSSGIQLSPLC